LLRHSSCAMLGGSYCRHYCASGRLRPSWPTGTPVDPAAGPFIRPDSVGGRERLGTPSVSLMTAPSW
jgi:hypothetical protein